MWFYWLNMGFVVFAFGLLLAFLIVSQYIRRDLPYDYAQLMVGSERFCYETDAFAYDGFWLYPAPFYATFCGLQQHLPQALFWGWMLAPFLLLIVFSGQRAAVFAYPPLYIHTLLGQSTWLLLPLYWLADRVPSVRWWHGLLLPVALFKPHIAVLPLVWLVWHQRRRWRFLATGLLSSMVVLVPAFALRPDWLVQWLAAGRGFKLVSVANVGIIPMQLLQLGETQQALVSSSVGLLLVLAFCGGIAALLVVALHRWRGTLDFYDWVLVFALTNPFIHDYDLVILLPLIANRPQRLLLALTAGLLAWLYAQMTANYNASVVIPLALLTARFVRLDAAFDRVRLPLRW